MNENNVKISCILDIGELLLSNGADVNRVEDTITRLSRAYDFRNCNVHAINSSIILTVTSPENEVITQARRITRIDTDLNKVAELNDLSRKICAGMTDLDAIAKEMTFIRENSPYHPLMIYFAYAISAAFFTLFFGGTWQDTLFSVPIALLLRRVQVRLSHFNDNKMVDNIILSAILTFCALAGQRIFPVLNSDMIIIGDIMLLIPGLAFCNSIHDMVMGDTISGVLSMFDAVLRALSIAIGYVAVWALMGRFL